MFSGALISYRLPWKWPDRCPQLRDRYVPQITFQAPCLALRWNVPEKPVLRARLVHNSPGRFAADAGNPVSTTPSHGL